MKTGTPNGQGSIMLNLIKGLIDDFKLLLDVSPSDLDRDFKTLTRRTQAEGPEFLTKTLPLLGKALDSYLMGNPFRCPTNFRRKKGTKLPLLFNGLFARVVGDGSVKCDVDPAYVKDIRQICFMFYKYELPYSQERIAECIGSFFETDESLSEVVPDVEAMSTVHFAKEIIDGIFSNEDFPLCHPRFGNGPGSVANGLRPAERFCPTEFYVKLDEIFSYSNCFFSNDRHLFDRFHSWYSLPFGSAGSAKLMAVPKDSRGPRLISSEQSEFMTYQQGLKNVLVPYIERNKVTCGQVNFTNQEINGRLALESSKTGRMSTLDLSEASDRLSLWLVDLLFEDTPIYRWIMNSRSTFTVYKTIKHRLKKFAPMGSALCFPIQSLSFYAIVVGALIREGEARRSAQRSVFVYGDDIIVPTKYYECAVQALESVGLKINRDKSCSAGLFRESCGVDGFNGVNVTPTKIKHVWQQTKPSVQQLVSWCTLSDNLFFKGYWKASDVVRRMLKRHIPIVLKTSTSPIIGLTTWSHDHAVEANKPRLKWSSAYQCWKQKAFIVKASSHTENMDGWQRLLRWFWESPPQDEHSKRLEFLKMPFSTAQFTNRGDVSKTLRVVYASSF